MGRKYDRVCQKWPAKLLAVQNVLHCSWLKSKSKPSSRKRLSLDSTSLALLPCPAWRIPPQLPTRVRSPAKADFAILRTPFLSWKACRKRAEEKRGGRKTERASTKSYLIYIVHVRNCFILNCIFARADQYPWSMSIYFYFFSNSISMILRIT